MAIASVHVNNSPLAGDWDGQQWEKQTARCSNNFMSGPTPPVPPSSAAAGLVWQVVGLADPDSVVFNVAVDLPDDDETLFMGVRNNTETTYLPTPTIDAYGKDGTPFHQEHRWDEYYSRGIYIASVHGAPEPFTVAVVGASLVQGISAVSVITGFTTTHVIGASGQPGGGAPFTVHVSGAEQASRRVIPTPQPGPEPSPRRSQPTG